MGDQVVTSGVRRSWAAAGAGVPAVCAVVPAGGGARRLGGLDKVAAPLAGRPLVEHLLAGLAAVAPQAPVVLVGPSRPVAAGSPGRPVLTCREDPPGGGPAAAVAAGVAALAGRGLLGAVVVVLPGDAPWSAAAVPALLAALDGSPGAGAAVAVDGGGRRQVLVAAHRTGPLLARLAELERAGGAAGAGLAGTPASRLLPAPPAVVVEVDVDDAVLADVDVPADLAAARARAEDLARAADPAREAPGDAPA